MSSRRMLCPAIFQCFLIIFLSGAVNTNSYMGVPYNQYYPNPSCSPGYVFVNGFCYNYGNIPQGSLTCPNGYVLQGNWCYPGCSTCSDSNSATTTSTTTNRPPILTTTTTIRPTTTTTTSRPIPPVITERPIPPVNIVSCPDGSVLTRGKCRKIICPVGELVNGQCLQITCPNGTVWHGRRCQEPAYVTTVLEIENVLLTEVHEKEGQVIRENITNIEYITEDSEIIAAPTTPKAITINPPDPITKGGCCKIISPRICKRYGHKWVCFHHRISRCDPELCKYPVIYLKTPSIVDRPPMLVMPPNPPLKACATPNCDESDIVDCSGCAQNQREGCSSQCYSYVCPQGTCNYVNLQDYCQSYPGEFGCKKDHGCMWDWCGER